MKQPRNARIWSNTELYKIAKTFKGSIINVSGEQDKDKQGGYEKYFVNADAYHISNYQLFNVKNEIFLDLEQELPEEYRRGYDVVFNHTVLEHIYDIRLAFKNLCLMARRAVIIVVPFVQEVHYKEGIYWDYWRPTPLAIKRMFDENSYTMLYYAHNNMEFTNTYLLCVGVRKGLEIEYKSIDNRPHNYYAGKWIQKYGSEWSKKGRIKKQIEWYMKKILKKK